MADFKRFEDEEEEEEGINGEVKNKKKKNKNKSNSKNEKEKERQRVESESEDEGHRHQHQHHMHNEIPVENGGEVKEKEEVHEILNENEAINQQINVEINAMYEAEQRQNQKEKEKEKEKEIQKPIIVITSGGGQTKAMNNFDSELSVRSFQRKSVNFDTEMSTRSYQSSRAMERSKGLKFKEVDEIDEDVNHDEESSDEDEDEDEEDGDRYVTWSSERLDQNPTGLREKIFLTFEDPKSSKAAFYLSCYLVFINFISTVCFCLQTLVSLNTTPLQQQIWFGIETFFIVHFTLEYLIRLCCCPKVNSFVVDPLNIIDLLAIAPYFFELAFYSVGIISRMPGVPIPKVLRLVRILRLINIKRDTPQIRLINQALKASREGIILLFVLVIITMVFFSTFIYYAETAYCVLDKDQGLWIYKNSTSHAGEPTPFQNIIVSFWWALVTISTTGFGDVVPITGLGRFIAAFAMVYALLVLAFPITITGANLKNAYQAEAVYLQKKELRLEKKKKKLEEKLKKELEKQEEAKKLDEEQTLTHKQEENGKLNENELEEEKTRQKMAMEDILYELLVHAKKIEDEITIFEGRFDLLQKEQKGLDYVISNLVKTEIGD